MCGIAGVVNFEGPLSARHVASLLRTTDAQLHRGPDDWGILLPHATLKRDDVRALLAQYDPKHIRCYADRGAGPWVGLGSRRLSVLDLSEQG
ncbi:MAG: hypothetical protein AB7O65_08605, partial [Candidatus Korobacteraceae bacterium]